MSSLRKYWYFHLTNVLFFFFFSGVGIFAGQALNERIKHAKEEAAMEIIGDLPLRALLEVHI